MDSGNALVKDNKALRTAIPSYGWVVTIVIWLSGICMPLNMLKVSILSPVIMSAFNVGVDGIGWIMAVFYVVGVVLAIPGAFIVSKLGCRTTLIMSLVCGIIGGLIGYFAQDVAVFMVSRVIEGIGFGLIGTAAVPAISSWFPPSRRGLPLGVWAIYVTVAFLVGPPLFSGIYTQTGDYHVVWLVCLIINVVILIVLVLFYRNPTFTFDENENIVFSAQSTPILSKPMRLGRVLKTPSVWLIGLIFFCEEVPFLGMSNFLTTYAVTATEIPLTTMSLIISSMAIVGCIMNPLSGRISDKIGSNKKLMVISCIGGTIYACLVFQATTVAEFIPVIICNALAGGIIPTMIWSATPKVVQHPEDIPAASAVVLLFQQLAAFLGSRVLGVAVASFGSFAFVGQYFMAPLFAIGLIIVMVGWKKLP
jgi:MFS family permease